MTDIEDRLRDGLEHGASQVDNTPRTPIGTVRSEARLIQRSRTRKTIGLTVSGLAAVAILAVVIPRTGGDGAAQPDPANRAPSGSATSTPRPGEALPVGPEPQVPFIVNTEYRLPDGGTVDLRLGASASSGVSELTPFDGGALVADGAYFEGTNGLYMVEGSRTTEIEACHSGAGAASDDQTTVAWATFPCVETGQSGPITVYIATTDGVTESFEVPSELDSNILTTVVGIVGDSVILNRVNDVIVASPDGTTRIIPEADAAIDVAAERAIMTGGPDGDRVIDVGTGQTVWTSDITLLSFSPDGDRVLGRQGKDDLVILDAATGEAVQEFDPAAPSGASVVIDSATGEVIQEFGLATPAGIQDVVWEDNTHLLYTLASGGFTSIVRVNLGNPTEPEQAGEVFAASQTVVLPNTTNTTP